MNTDPQKLVGNFEDCSKEEQDMAFLAIYVSRRIRQEIERQNKNLEGKKFHQYDYVMCDSNVGKIVGWDDKKDAYRVAFLTDIEKLSNLDILEKQKYMTSPDSLTYISYPEYMIKIADPDTIPFRDELDKLVSRQEVSVPFYVHS